MKLQLVYFKIIVLLLVTSCRNKSITTSIDIPNTSGPITSVIGKHIILDNGKLNVRNIRSKYNVLYSFDASCSGCVVELIDVLHKYSLNKGAVYDNTNFYFIGMTSNPELLKYHLKKNKVNLQENQYLIFDTTNSYGHINSKVIEPDAINTILTDNSFKIISKDSPFHNPNAKQIYQKLGVLR